MSIIELSDVHKIYPLGETEVHAVKGVSFTVESGDFVSIAGPSGSGKSTILNMIGCIDVPTSGLVRVTDTDTSTLNDEQITDLRHDVVGFIFQSFNLVPVLDVFENVQFPLLLGRSGSSSKEADEWVTHLIDEVGLGDWRRHRPSELSGGQRQRVAIARALATRPRVVLADEPTANLDSTTGEQIIELMKRMNHDLGTTFVFSTHDPSTVDIADHIIRRHDGEASENFRRDVERVVE